MSERRTASSWEESTAGQRVRGNRPEHLVLAPLEDAAPHEAIGELVLEALAEPVDEVLRRALLLRDLGHGPPQQVVVGRRVRAGMDLAERHLLDFSSTVTAPVMRQLDQQRATQNGLQVGGPDDVALLVVEQQQEQVFGDQRPHAATLRGGHG